MWRIVWGLVATLSLTSPARADAVLNITTEVQSKCGLAPLGSVVLEGATATKDEMAQAKLQVISFVTQTDLFQNCVLAVQASFKDKLTTQDKAAILKIIDDSQKEKEAIGAEYNEAVDAYNAARHRSGPGPVPQAKPKTSGPASNPR